MGASPQAALVQVTLPPLAPELQRRWMAEIMGAASEVFADEGAVIAGGHTSVGAEFSLGFSLTGLPLKNPIVLSGAQSGDRLLLTRPVGSGVLFAGEMQGLADGNCIASLLEVLCQSQANAARILSKHAHAMTDVTGFGLSGHLCRMAEASGLTARLHIAAIPFFDGAPQLAKDGLRSTLWEANRAAHPVEVPATPEGDLLFDPQTAGGLLAAVPAEEAESLLEEVRALGHTAALVARWRNKDRSAYWRIDDPFDQVGKCVNVAVVQTICFQDGFGGRFHPFAHFAVARIIVIAHEFARQSFKITRVGEFHPVFDLFVPLKAA